MKCVALLLLVSFGLAGCSTVGQTVSSIGSRRVVAVDRHVTSEAERAELIRQLGNLSATHRADALREIANR